MSNVSVDEAFPELDIVLIKQWFYCPRFVYLKYVLNLREPSFEYLIEGKRLHEDLARREEVRKTLLQKPRFRYDKKLVHVLVHSKRLGLKGILDILIIRDGKPIPVEIKLCEASGMVPIHHKAQLVAYALCLEEMFGKVVTEGYLYYVKSDKLVPVRIVDDLRNLVVQELEKIRACLLGLEIPERASDKRKCVNCWFRKYCMKMRF